MSWTNTYLTTYEFICSCFNEPVENLRADLLYDCLGLYARCFHAKLLVHSFGEAILLFPYDHNEWNIGRHLYYDISRKDFMVLKDGEWFIYIYVDRNACKVELL